MRDIITLLCHYSHEHCQSAKSRERSEAAVTTLLPYIEISNSEIQRKWQSELHWQKYMYEPQYFVMAYKFGMKLESIQPGNETSAHGLGLRL